jgi:uncharacterized protein
MASPKKLKMDTVKGNITDEELIELARGMCKKILSKNDASHDYSHAFRVAASAQELAKQEEGVDVLVVTLAAILHDVADHKYYESQEEADSVLAATLGSLLAAGLSEQRVTMVRYVIDNVSFSSELGNKGIYPAISRTQ